MLNEKIKKELLKKAEKIQINVDELDSYVWDRNPYGVEEQLATFSACGDWNENEEWHEQIKTLIRWLSADGLNEYATLSDEEQELDEKTRELTHEAINWLNTLI